MQSFERLLPQNLPAVDEWPLVADLSQFRNDRVAGNRPGALLLPEQVNLGLRSSSAAPRSLLSDRVPAVRRPRGFRSIRVHDLKHTYGHRLRAAGVGFEDRKLLLGHESDHVTTHDSAPEIGR